MPNRFSSVVSRELGLGGMSFYLATTMPQPAMQSNLCVHVAQGGAPGKDEEIWHFRCRDPSMGPEHASVRQSAHYNTMQPGWAGIECTVC